MKVDLDAALLPGSESSARAYPPMVNQRAPTAGAGQGK